MQNVWEEFKQKLLISSSEEDTINRKQLFD